MMRAVGQRVGELLASDPLAGGRTDFYRLAVAHDLALFPLQVYAICALGGGPGQEDFATRNSVCARIFEEELRGVLDGPFPVAASLHPGRDPLRLVGQPFSK